MNSEWPLRQRAQNGKFAAGTHTAAQSLSPGLMRLCCQSTNAIVFLNQDIMVRTEDTEVKVLACPLFQVSVLTAFSSSTLCAPVIKVNQVSSFHQHCSNESAALVVTVLQSLSHVRLFVTPWTIACQASLSITDSWSLLKLMAVDSVMPSNHLIFYSPLPLPPSIFPSIRVLYNGQFFISGGQRIEVSASASVCPMNIQN